MSTRVTNERGTRIREILGAFELSAGSTVSGVAYGGRFAAATGGAAMETHDPASGEVLALVKTAGEDDVARAVSDAHQAFARWRMVPAPHRGEIVSRLGDGFRKSMEV